VNRRSAFLTPLVVVAALVTSSGVLGAGEAGRKTAPRGNPGNQPNVSAAASEVQGHPAEFYGVGLAAPVYFVNFLLLYIANPNEAANMPAYRAALPMALSDCLESNPAGCSYSRYALSFDDSAKGNKSCGWPTVCQTNPKWEELAPIVARRGDQINEPLGLERANRLAGLLGIDKSMILTDQEYECTIGIPPRDTDRQTIFACINNLTNSNGSTNIPLSSYGLAITDDRNGSVPAGDVQSLCAPNAPCLVFNDLFSGPLERIAAVCGWETKLARMVAETSFGEFAEDGSKCQEFAGSKSGGPCIVEAVCTSGRPGF
jgi:hypothetical protein